MAKPAGCVQNGRDMYMAQLRFLFILPVLTIPYLLFSSLLTSTELMFSLHI